MQRPIVYVLPNLFAGRVGEIELDRSGAMLTVNSFTEFFGRMMPRNVYQVGCRHTLFDAGCRANKNSFTFTGAVTDNHGGDQTQGFDTDLSQNADYFSLGRLVWTSGNNVGFPVSIRLFSQPAGNIVLLKPAPFSIEVGDTFLISAGCDKTMSTCSNKFNNLINYGGFPYIPRPEMTV